MADFTFKIIVVGSSGVGKTAVVQRYVRRSFKEHDTSTIGVDIGIKLLRIDNYKIQVGEYVALNYCAYCNLYVTIKIVYIYTWFCLNDLSENTITIITMSVLYNQRYPFSFTERAVFF